MPPRLVFKPVWFLGLCLVALPCAAQPFDFPGGAVEDPVALFRAMPGLAREVIAVYREDDRRTYLDNLFRLQIVAGQYAEANESLTSLRALGASSVSPQAGAASRRFQSGSRLVVVLSVNKWPGAQINYGTGMDVSDETIADGKEPLKIKWFAGSFIDVPVRR